jgi:hypothetical protein
MGGEDEAPVQADRDKVSVFGPLYVTCIQPSRKRRTDFIVGLLRRALQIAQTIRTRKSGLTADRDGERDTLGDTTRDMSRDSRDASRDTSFESGRGPYNDRGSGGGGGGGNEPDPTSDAAFAAAWSGSCTGAGAGVVAVKLTANYTNRGKLQALRESNKDREEEGVGGGMGVGEALHLFHLQVSRVGIAGCFYQ